MTYAQGAATADEGREAVHALATLAGALGIKYAQIALDAIDVLDEQLKVADSLNERLEDEIRETRGD